jgi:3-hydroxyisobutyrate dehydrogenase-like beta-hydroxyacid dehydrogenase
VTALGFVGLGHMGGNMAVRFLGAGYTVYGETRHRREVQDLEREGLIWRDTPREIAEAADVVFTSVPTDSVLEDVASAPDGILAGLAAGKVWVEMSTVSPHVSRDLAQLVREHGAAMLDAPVSGSVPQVQTGTLTIMVGGDEHAYARVEPILRELGTPTHIGENGQGLVLKLAINISLAAQALAFSEGLLLAERGGIDAKLAADAIAASAVGSPMLKARVPLFLDPGEEAWFEIRLMHKDIRLACQTAHEEEVPVPATEAVEEVLGQASERGYDDKDIAAIHEVLAGTV